MNQTKINPFPGPLSSLLSVPHTVFPSSTRFVFIMGTSIALSTNSLLCAGATRCSLLRKTVWRSLQLFIIGVFIINPNYCQGPCEYKHNSYMLMTKSLNHYLTVILEQWSKLLTLGVIGSFLDLFGPVCSHSLLTPPPPTHTVSWDNLRIPGVLQRLAWSYLVVACLDLLVAKGHLDILTTVSQQLLFTHVL